MEITYNKSRTTIPVAGSNKAKGEKKKKRKKIFFKKNGEVKTTVIKIDGYDLDNESGEY